MNVERLAPFFREFRAGLRTSAQRTEPRICILTPGPWSQTYFEQAYLARYLGFLLVEGDDLVMRDGHIFVRTIAGLKRADVLWRHVDADWCDPLELNPSSRIGVPGLIDAIRAGAVAVENMPGSGLLESRALAGVHAGPRPPPARRRTDDAEHRDMVVRPGRRARKGARLARRDRHRRRRSATGFPALATSAASSARSSPRRSRAACARDRRARRRFCRPGHRPAFDDAAMGEWTPGAAPLRAARLCRRDAGRLARHAGRFLPHIRQGRRARRLDGRRRRIGRCLGARRQSGRDDEPVAVARKGAHRAPARQSAEPRRRQSVLVRPLSRTRGSDLAAGALHLHPRGRSRHARQ